MRKLMVPLFVIVALVTTFMTLNPLGSASAATVSIDAGSNWFCSSAFQTQPCVTSITAGDTVTWTVVQGFHTVTECDAGHVNCGNGFESGILQNGDSFSRTFNTAGSVSYYCALHPDMTGVLNVQEPPATPSPAPADTTTAPPAAGSAVPTAAQSPGSVPQTGGPPADSTAPLWPHLLALGGLLAFGGGSAAFAARRR